MSDIILKLLLAYVIGSIMGSLLLGKMRHVDIRSMGSGNAGGTNALRTQGKAFALGVVIIDIGKGALAAGWVPYLALTSTEPTAAWLSFACGAAAVVGHVYPIFHGFRGGKGAATLVGTILVLAPMLVLPLLAVWVLTIALTGFVGLATMVTGEAALLLTIAFYQFDKLELLVYTFVMGMFIVFTHRSNIGRMLQGTEPRNERMMLLRKR
ncbi:MAG: glycerol-3-phosphate 1-O-acyltransferase PlsY [Pseudomonadota bacterium]